MGEPITSEFTCKASGDVWSVVSRPVDHDVSCSARCLLRDVQRQQDSACSPDLTSVPVCEGFPAGQALGFGRIGPVACVAPE